MKTRENPVNKRAEKLSEALDDIKDYIDDLQVEVAKYEENPEPANRLRHRRR